MFVNWQSDSDFAIVDNFVRGQQPNLKNARIVTVMIQYVNGINYKITYMVGSISIEIVVYKPPNGALQITSNSNTGGYQKF